MDIILFIVIIVIVVKATNKNKKKTTNYSGKTTQRTIATGRKSNVSPAVSPKNQTSSNQKKAERENYQSTMEMLRQKAEEEQAEHEKDKRYAEYKKKKTYKEKYYAQRLIPGDPVPKGMYVKKCGYCGAENLLAYGSGEKMLCYFCREEL